MEQDAPKVDAHADDAAAFVEYANRLLAGLATHCSASRVLVVRVRGWFDDKWVGFSGKALGAIGVHAECPRVPPFVSKRLVSSAIWTRAGNDWVREVKETGVHHHGRSAENLIESRRYDAVLPDTTGVWLSTASALESRAAVMVYASHEGAIEPFYAGLSLANGVRICRLKGISEPALRALLRAPAES